MKGLTGDYFFHFLFLIFFKFILFSIRSISHTQKKKKKKKCGCPTGHNFSHSLDRKQSFSYGQPCTYVCASMFKPFHGQLRSSQLKDQGNGRYFFFKYDTLIITLPCSDYVRKYLDVKNHAFLNDFMRDFDHLYAQFFNDNQNRNNGCEIRAFCLRIVRVFKF